jgi:hypothetical protein
VKFYRIEPDDITQIATSAGWIRPEPDPLLAEAFGEVYERRWTDRGGYLVPSAPSRAQTVTPPGMAADEFEAIMSRSGITDLPVIMPGDDDATAAPARKRMRDFIRRSPGPVTPKMITDLLARENMGVARQTVQRWLAEGARAGLIEQAGTFGRWKWRA